MHSHEQEMINNFWWLVTSPGSSTLQASRNTDNSRNLLSIREKASSIEWNKLSVEYWYQQRKHAIRREGRMYTIRWPMRPSRCSDSMDPQIEVDWHRIASHSGPGGHDQRESQSNGNPVTTLVNFRRSWPNHFNLGAERLQSREIPRRNTGDLAFFYVWGALVVEKKIGGLTEHRVFIDQPVLHEVEL